MMRIQRDVVHEELIQVLTNGENAVFGEIWRLQVFAFTVGIKTNSRRSLQKVDSNKNIPENYFGIPSWKGLLYLAGVTETGASDCLVNSQDNIKFLVKIFEEYSNGGLFKIEEYLSQYTDYSEGILSLIQELTKQEEASSIEFPTI